jgi:hypothetical protein
MQYYTFELDKESQDLFTSVTPCGKYKYLRLPLGLKCYPDIAQATMENVLLYIEDADVYIDDVGAFFNDWNHHVNLLSTIVGRLRKNGFLINTLECELAFKETDWLGYGLTPCGLKPWEKKSMPSFIWIVLTMPQNCVCPLMLRGLLLFRVLNQQ